MIDSCNESLAVDGLAYLCLSRRSGTLPKPCHDLLGMDSHSIAVCGADEQYITEIWVPCPAPAIQYDVGMTRASQTLRAVNVKTPNFVDLEVSERHLQRISRSGLVTEFRFCLSHVSEYPNGIVHGTNPRGTPTGRPKRGPNMRDCVADYVSARHLNDVHRAITTFTAMRSKSLH